MQWVQCPTCKLWFKTPDILAVDNCYIDPENIIPAIGGSGAGPLSNAVQDQQEEQHPESEQEPSRQEQEEEEEQESEVDRYWCTHSNPKPRVKDYTTVHYRIQ